MLLTFTCKNISNIIFRICIRNKAFETYSQFFDTIHFYMIIALYFDGSKNGLRGEKCPEFHINI